MGNAVGISERGWRYGEWHGNVEAVGRVLPCVSKRRNALLVPRSVDLGFVDHVRIDRPDVPDLIAVSGPDAGRGNRRKGASVVESAEGIVQPQVVMDVA